MRMSKIKRIRIMPPTYFWAMLIASVLLHFFVPVKKLIASPYNYLGILLVVFGIIINLMTDSLFKKAKTCVKPHEMPRSLVVSGPFRISRHPMYLGMLAILFGAAILLGSIMTFIPPIIFLVLMECLFIPMEERNLKKRFGSSYLDYKKSVRRWI
ncbi:isoprenylcysteine carboxylmethyltransferase family protein [Candidatus Woesearchaeota archaeon]|nr:isoprenylcysteine carboxylmethyltransferase family protein [Candidatus Woesearchaeota archaeon]